jgi:hypothetical protein
MLLDKYQNMYIPAPTVYMHTCSCVYMSYSCMYIRAYICTCMHAYIGPWHVLRVCANCDANSKNAYTHSCSCIHIHTRPTSPQEITRLKDMHQKGLSESMLRKAKKFEASLATTQTQTEMANKMMDQGMGTSPIASAAPAARPSVEQIQTQKPTSSLEVEPSTDASGAGPGDAAPRVIHSASMSSAKVQGQRSRSITPQAQSDNISVSATSGDSVNVSVDSQDALDSTVTAVDSNKVDSEPVRHAEEERQPSGSVASELEANVQQHTASQDVVEAEAPVVKKAPEGVAGMLCGVTHVCLAHASLYACVPSHVGACQSFCIMRSAQTCA